MSVSLCCETLHSFLFFFCPEFSTDFILRFASGQFLCCGLTFDACALSDCLKFNIILIFYSTGCILSSQIGTSDRIRFDHAFFFPGFSTSRYTENFQNGKFPDSRKSLIPRVREIPKTFSRKFFASVIVLPIFLIFSISDPNFSILLYCFDKLSLSFSIFLTN